MKKKAEAAKVEDAPWLPPKPPPAALDCSPEFIGTAAVYRRRLAPLERMRDVYYIEICEPHGEGGGELVRGHRSVALKFSDDGRAGNYQAAWPERRDCHTYAGHLWNPGKCGGLLAQLPHWTGMLVWPSPVRITLGYSIAGWELAASRQVLVTRKHYGERTAEETLVFAESAGAAETYRQALANLQAAPGTGPDAAAWLKRLRALVAELPDL